MKGICARRWQWSLIYHGGDGRNGQWWWEGPGIRILNYPESWIGHSQYNEITYNVKVPNTELVNKNNDFPTVKILLEGYHWYFPMLTITRQIIFSVFLYILSRRSTQFCEAGSLTMLLPFCREEKNFDFLRNCKYARSIYKETYGKDSPFIVPHFKSNSCLWDKFCVFY